MMANHFHPQSQQFHKPLGTYLVEAGLLTEAQVGVILADQDVISLPFGEIVATRGWLKQETIEYLMDKVVLPERKTAPPLDRPPGACLSSKATNPTPTIPEPANFRHTVPPKSSTHQGYIQSFAQEVTPTAEDESISWIG